jgi:DNA mismatch endonuclease (patch repair protein)
MSRVKGHNTGLEKLVFSALRKQGIKFSKHVKNLPGKPDAVIRNKKIALFIDGDFWHGYRFPVWKDGLPEFWKTNINKNRLRDRNNFAKLRRQGWKAVRIWGHEIKVDPDIVIAKLDDYV